MKFPALPLRRTAAALALAASIAHAQKSDSSKSKDKPKDKYTSSKFWEGTEPFEMTLSVNLKQLKSDKGDPGPWRAATVSYVNGTATKTHPARVRTRGRSRLKICDNFPPIWLDLAKDDVKGTPFQHLNRLKLVSPCKTPPDYERYVLGEFNIYRITALFTPVSHRARLIHLTVTDSASQKPLFTKYAFALEDIDEVAERLGSAKLAVTGLNADDLDPRQTALMGLLQYMIGNTDFSFSARHNLEFVPMKGSIYPIVFDYDQAGLINTVYAIPDPSLGIKSVTQRMYRGLCVSPDTVKAVIAEMKAKRPEVESLYKDDIGKLMGGQTVSQSLRFLSGFYSDIDNPKTVQKEILDRCAKQR